MDKKFALSIVRKQYGEDIEKNRKFKNIKSFFDTSEKQEYTIDDDTWSDMDMNRVYEKLDRTYSTPGEAVLYYMLRNPLKDEEKLKKRDKLIEAFKNDSDLREKLLRIFLELSTDAKNTFLDMIESELVVNKFKYYLYTLLGKVVPIISIILIILFGEKYALMIMVSSSLNMFINYTEKNTVKSRGIIYLRDIIKASKKISNMKNDDIKKYIENITINLKEIKDIDRSTLLIGIINMWHGFFEVISTLFLVEECAYYRISAILKEKKKYIMNIFYALGEIDAMLSISSYQKSLEENYVKPNFTKEVSLNIIEGVHPLLDNPVANSISIKHKGIVLTGTNMSGKSTFLRMLGINILLSQTFYFALAKEYKASFFNIVSSISPNDDLSKGKSYYMAEAEGILRIVNAFKKELPVFCPIDEIFRGTNPIERIAMSAEILTYINNGRSIPIVATHDRELVDILKGGYEFYYFSEDVDSENGLSFDYKLKVGVSQTRNAIRLLDYIGYPKEVTEGAYKRAETIEGFI
ncbi:DNA mismatch repair protein MutS [Clostridium tetani]|uniref:MutS-related protein n=1 Tax=Clostridium tetani TaxID=1513 RepID=UPI00100A5A1F|nr:DNA mismatch repair protein MutS [Clostridium tetani]RXI47226.1 DNA mismatch repair protein MutS [Clostridium tetani]RXM62370.1 DNA mismatch repair protein MutS [Clostridium tetani]RXM68821.1 DNA mismatch repair protein MutS [Clostridium tetani]